MIISILLLAIIFLLARIIKLLVEIRDQIKGGY